MMGATYASSHFLLGVADVLGDLFGEGGALLRIDDIQGSQRRSYTPASCYITSGNAIANLRRYSHFRREPQRRQKNQLKRRQKELKTTSVEWVTTLLANGSLRNVGTTP